MIPANTKVQVDEDDIKNLVSVVAELGKEISGSHKSSMERFEDKLADHIGRYERDFELLAKSMAETNESMQKVGNKLTEVVSEMRTNDAERNNLIRCLNDIRDETKKNGKEIHELELRVAKVETKQEDRYGWQSAALKIVLPIIFLSMIGVMGFFAKAFFT